MSFLKSVLAALFLMLPTTLAAQMLQGNPVGYWRCIANNSIVSIDLQLQIAPNQTLQHQGSIVYVQTNRIYNVRGFGRWAIVPPDPGSTTVLYRFQMQPADGNHAMFSIFSRPTQDPNFMANQFYNHQTGDTTDTRCQRLG